MEIPATEMTKLAHIIRGYMLKRAEETSDKALKEALEGAYMSFRTKHLHALTKLPDADNSESASDNYGAYGIRFRNLVFIVVLSSNFDGSVNVLFCEVKQI